MTLYSLLITIDLLTNDEDTFVHYVSSDVPVQRILAGAIIVPLDDKTYVYSSDFKSFTEVPSNASMPHQHRLYRHVFINGKTGYVAVSCLKRV